jgi:sugar lactone lactonase YvrE
MKGLDLKVQKPRFFQCFILLALLLCSLPCRAELQVVREIAQGPGNLTITPDGQIIVSLHQFYAPSMAAALVDPQGGLKPFPNDAWAEGRASESVALDSVLGLQSDSQGVVWMLDNGMRSQITPKLVAWDTQQKRLQRVIYLPPPITVKSSFLNDLAVDEKHRAIYIADPAAGSNAAIIVVDIDTGHARRVLQGHKSVLPEELDLFVDNQPVQVKQADGTTTRPRVGINPIALDSRAEWLYYGPMHGHSMYRVRTRDLLDPYFSAAMLNKQAERYSDKPICDGISIDKDNNIYVTDIANNAVGVIDITGKYRILYRDEKLSWPDAFSFGPDGKLYTVANQLHKSAMLNGGKTTARPPFLVFRLDPLTTGQPGR